LQEFGLHTDWRRSFITTEANPYYDSYIRWQFNILKQKEKLRFGKRYTIFSALDNQPCADHDRSKGEGVGPQEYTIIKIKALELPASLKDLLAGKDVFLVAATLRAEGEYGVFEMKNGEYYICSERSARNMAYQDLTPHFGKY
jgi:leucyl-tRNA synthetase